MFLILFKTIVFQILLYVLQFWVLPLVMKLTIYSSDAHTGIWVISVSTVAFTAVCMYFWSDKFRFWLLGIILYGILSVMHMLAEIPYFYITSGPLAEIGSLFTIPIVAFIQFAVWCIVKIIKAKMQVKK